MEVNFRSLKLGEVEVRVGQVFKDKGLSLLLYKTARTDSKLLDETVGAMNWSNEYKEIKGNLFCGITIYDRTNNTSVTKWNCGTESNMEREKGEASDAMKRAGFAWGIGVELYDTPLLYIPKEKFVSTDGKYEGFKVSAIEIESHVIKSLTIVNKKNEVVFTFKR